MEIREFIEARLADDQAWAHGVVRQTEEWSTDYRSPTWYVSPADCERTLREVAAKRAIIADLDKARAQAREHPKDFASTGWMLGMMRALAFLALAWEDHPDFDPAWRIDG